MVGVGLFCINVSECKGGELFPHLQIFWGKFSTIMSEIISRIKQFADSQGISNRALERTMGVSEGTMSKAFRNNTEIRTDNIESIVENYPQLSAEWLLRGEGEMLKKEVVSESEIVSQLIKRIEELVAKNTRLEDLLKSKGGVAQSAGDSLSASAV